MQNIDYLPASDAEFQTTFDLSQLRCFVSVAEELHFGRAAKRLNLTQPPVSRQIQVLEHILNVELLERTSRSVRLTPAGRGFLPEARRILKLAESAALVARKVAAGKAGSLRLGFTGASAYQFLPSVVMNCVKQLPDVAITLKEMVSADQIDALSSNQIDAGFFRPPIIRPDLKTALAVSEPLVAAIPENHVLAGADYINLEDLHFQPFIMYAPYEASYFYNLLTAHFAAAEVMPNYVLHLSQIHTILSFVGVGLGLALIPKAASLVRAPGVVFARLQFVPEPLAQLYMVWRAGDDNPLLEKLAAIVQTAGGQMGLKRAPCLEWRD